MSRTPMIRKRVDGAGRIRWQARIAAPDGRQRAETFDRKNDAKAWLDRQKADIAEGRWIDPRAGRRQFSALVDEWAETLHHLTHRSRRLSVGVARNHLVPRFGKWPIAKIRRADVQKMLSGELDAGELSNSAIRRHVIVLSQILQFAVDDGLLAVNVAKGVKLPPENTPKARFLTAGQLHHIADAVGEHYTPLVLTAGYTGLRWGELAGLEVAHVKFLNRQIVVEQQLEWVGTEARFSPPKTKASRRTVATPTPIIDMLANVVERWQVQQSGLMFPSLRGHPMRNPTFRRVWVRARAAAGFDDDPDTSGLKFHELRHTAVALAVEVGAHPMAIKERLGHASITTTLDRYGGLFESIDEQIGERLGLTFSDAAGSRVDENWTWAESPIGLRRSE